VNHEGDLFRTRLTHSIEVAQIARTISRALDLNEDLAEAIALAHDLGHTPFGHAGQDALNTCMKEHGGFEHNLQSLRTVDVLEERYAEFDGLNLCFETREGILKHCSPVNAAALGQVGKRFLERTQPTLEAQVCNLADEIAYNNHDIDDGIKAGLLELSALKDISLWQKHFEQTQKNFSELPLHKKVRITVRKMIDALVTDLIEHTTQEIENRNIKTFDDVKANGKNLVDFSRKTKTELDELQKCLFKNLYRHYRVVRMAEKAKRVLRELFNAYTGNPNTVPQDFKKKYESRGDSDVRIVCDYIAGMTDRFALQEYSKLFDPYAKV
jgi:dGTPase